jgi:hypothetical protein
MNAMSVARRPLGRPQRLRARRQFDVELTVARAETLTSPLLPGFELALDDLSGD